MSENYNYLERARNRFQPLITQRLNESATLRKPKELLAYVASQEYKYQNLPSPSCIRLLHLERGAGSDPIHCASLQITDLDNEPEFTALSYSWLEDRSITWPLEKYSKLMFRHNYWIRGQNFRAQLGKRESVSDKEIKAKYLELKEEMYSAPDPRLSSRWQMLFVDGKSMAIQPNLYKALLHLRKTRPGWYWIDAVCMNQKDTQERSAQVQMMDRIYHAAAEVVVWLGDVPMLLNPGFEQLCEKLMPEPEISPSQSSTHYFILPEIYQAAVYLLTRRWFRRLWVVQESCLAQRITFVIGDHEFNSRAIAAMVPWLETLPESETLTFVGIFFPTWIESIKKIPAMLESTSFFLDGRRWDVREWLEVALSRKATDPRDLVFAGLSLIDAEVLTVDQSLQLAQESFGSGITHPRLWKVLHANYDVDTSFVLLNLAACLLTHWDINTLFSTVLRYRTRATRSTKYDLPLFRQPSWVPLPGNWTSRPSKPVFLLRNASGQFPFPTDTQDPGPKISADGTVLFLTAVKLDTIARHCPLGVNHFDDIKNELIDLLKWIAEAVPRVHSKTGLLGLDTFVRVACSKYRIEGPLAQLSDAELLAYFCWLIEGLQEVSTSAGSKLESNSESAESSDVDKLSLVDPSEVGAIITKIKANHPDAPWPDRVKGSSKSEKKRMMQMYKGMPDKPSKEQMSTNIDKLQRFMNVPSLGNRYVEDWSTQSMFITEEGYIGIGPNVLRDGDAVFLIRGSNMPYIFADANEVLRRRASRIREQLTEDVKITERAADALKKELEEVEGMTDSKEGWRLVGETYIEGVMKGEVAAEMKEREQRYGFV